eukprot:2172839-Prymnesium_polylepis.3
MHMHLGSAEGTLQRLLERAGSSPGCRSPKTDRPPRTAVRYTAMVPSRPDRSVVGGIGSLTPGTNASSECGAAARSCRPTAVRRAARRRSLTMAHSMSESTRATPSGTAHCRWCTCARKRSERDAPGRTSPSAAADEEALATSSRTGAVVSSRAVAAVASCWPPPRAPLASAAAPPALAPASERPLGKGLLAASAPALDASRSRAVCMAVDDAA